MTTEALPALRPWKLDMPGTPLFPEQASTMAPRVDNLYFFLVGVSVVMTLLIAGFIVYFAFKYRRRSAAQIGVGVTGGFTLELIWIVVPLAIVMVMFFWGASVFFAMARPPDNAMDVYVVGKQWMWKFQHAGGQSEINELHVPVNQPVKLTMTSQDVIHDLFFPAFRVKADVIPGRYSTMWFEATKTGEFPLYCAEYCGTDHSGMIGRVVVMEPEDFQQWLAAGAGMGTLADAGERLFQNLACNTCHLPDGRGRGPSLQGLFGNEVLLDDGRTVVADEAYIRQSILNPRATTVAGFQQTMPTYQGLISEEGMLQLIEYIKALQPGDQTPQPAEGQQPPVRTPGDAGQGAQQGERPGR
jgi:cytochrome c oxidase subunit II